MRTKRTDYRETSMRSIARDFARGVLRVASVGENSGYFRHRRLLVGKAVRVVGECPAGKYCEFVNEADRRALNAACGWNEKRTYLFDCVKFK